MKCCRAARSIICVGVGCRARIWEDQPRSVSRSIIVGCAVHTVTASLILPCASTAVQFLGCNAPSSRNMVFMVPGRRAKGWGANNAAHISAVHLAAVNVDLKPWNTWQRTSIRSLRFSWAAAWIACSRNRCNFERTLRRTATILGSQQQKEHDLLLSVRRPMRQAMRSACPAMKGHESTWPTRRKQTWGLRKRSTSSSRRHSPWQSRRAYYSEAGRVSTFLQREARRLLVWNFELGTTWTKHTESQKRLSRFD